MKPKLTTPESERQQVCDNIGLAFVNGKITQDEAATALAALDEQWSEMDGNQ